MTVITAAVAAILLVVVLVQRLCDAFLTVSDPADKGAGFEFADLGIVALWGVAATIIGTTTFRWAPRTG